MGLWQAGALANACAPMNVLSIQSFVSFGHVGNRAAILPLERLGHEVWPVNTVSLAHHPGYGAWRGRVAAPEEIATLIDGLEARGALGRCDAVLSGYLGDAALGPVLLDAVRRVRKANPKALFCCDPVMGDGARGFFVRAGIPEFFRDEAAPVADLLLPNAFELGWLTGLPVDDLASALAAARALIARGPRLVVVTGLRRTVRVRPRIGALAVEVLRAWHAEAPLIAAPANGAGDVFAALFLGHYLRGRRPGHALERAVSALHAVMAKTAALGSGELALVESQDAFLGPKRLFKAEKMG